MKARLFAEVVGATALLALGLVPRTGQASEEYDPFSGYGTHSARLGLQAGLLSGTLPASASHASYSQGSYTAVINGMLFAEPTVFGTLLGIELGAALGVRTVSKPDGVTDPEAATEGVKPTGHADFEFAYDLMRWKLAMIRQRIIINAGGGFDYNSHPWQWLNGSSGWRAYPLLGGHVQTSVGDSFLLDVAYRFVPTQSKDGVGAEHRFQAGLGIGRIQVGADYVVTRVVGDGAGPLEQTRFGGFAAWAL